MSIDMMNARVSIYFDLMAQIEQLQAEAESIKDELKGQYTVKTTGTRFTLNLISA